MNQDLYRVLLIDLLIFWLQFPFWGEVQVQDILSSTLGLLLALVGITLGGIFRITCSTEDCTCWAMYWASTLIPFYLFSFYSIFSPDLLYLSAIVKKNHSWLSLSQNVWTIHQCTFSITNVPVSLLSYHLATLLSFSIADISLFLFLSHLHTYSLSFILSLFSSLTLWFAQLLRKSNCSYHFFTFQHPVLIQKNRFDYYCYSELFYIVHIGSKMGFSPLPAFLFSFLFFSFLQ